MWTQFMDMYSGGGLKEGRYDHIYIEAPEHEARLIFYNRFGHNPERVSCTCCGEDYSITESVDLKQATGYERGCHYDERLKKYIEEHDHSKWGGFKKYQTLEHYFTKPTVLIIPADEIKPKERRGSVPQQGYVWQD